MNKFAIGIDFGTTTSRIHYFAKSDSWFMPEDVPEVRSIVAATQDENGELTWYTGHAASAFGFHRFKLKMGLMDKLDPSVEFSRPEILASRLIWVLRQQLKKHAKNTVGASYDVLESLDKTPNVTITIPAGWHARQRSATIFAAKMAGFTNIYLIEEPMAAFIAIAKHRPSLINEAQNILVFDYGGGTLDLAVIQRDLANISRLPKIMAQLTAEKFGAGEDIDEKIARLWIEKLWPGNQIWEAMDGATKHKFREAARFVKHQLNPRDRHMSQPPQASANPLTISVAAFPDRIQGKEIDSNSLTLTIEEFDGIVQPLTARVLTTITELLESHGMSVMEINKIIMVGGSSYLRSIQQGIREMFSDNNVVTIEPEKAVVVGAATYQSMLNSRRAFRRRKYPFFEPSLTLDTYLKYDREIEGHIEKDTYFLGKVGDSLNKDIRNKGTSMLPIPVEINFPLTWKVYQKQPISDATEYEIARVKILQKPNKTKTRLFLVYRINRNGELTLWRPRLVGKSNNQGLHIAVLNPYDWAGESPEKKAQDYNIIQNHFEEE